MNTSTRLGLTVLTAATLVGALAGCATGAAVPTSSTSARTVTTAPPVPTPTPSTSPTTPAATPTPTAGPTSGASALAQHVFEACSTGAAENGISLTFTADPSGMPGPDGDYQLVYPFTFVDGHTDPYAIYTCTLTDDTVTSSYVRGGLSDTH